MKTIKLIICLLTVISFVSCEDVIQVKLDQGEPMVTVDAFVNDMRSQQKIRLTYTDGYFSQKPNEPITGASVHIKDLTSGLDYAFTDNTNGDYVLDLATTDTMGRVGHEYELTIVHQGTTFKASSRMNRTTKVDSLIAEYKEGGGLGGGKEGYKFSFLGFDPPGDTVDYYWIKSYRNGVFFNKGGEINICANGAYGQGADGFPFITPIAQAVTPFGEVFNKYDVCRVEIHSIDLLTYNFLTQVQTQTTNSGLFATSPENVKTNIKNVTGDKVRVVGWFCMSAVGFKEGVAQ
ncbi:MAG: DUF4249 domain-containing protein [Bacteroidetes bacterium]|nr:DUF4249 domain-containing protein [Bacteroidota bacterium]